MRQPLRADYYILVSHIASKGISEFMSEAHGVTFSDIAVERRLLHLDSDKVSGCILQRKHRPKNISGITIPYPQHLLIGVRGHMLNTGNFAAFFTNIEVFQTS